MRMRAIAAMAAGAVMTLAAPTLATPAAVSLPAVAGHQSVVYWGGFAWAVDPGVFTSPAGGPKTDAPSAVWVDAADRLHLRLVPTAHGFAGPSLTALTQPGYGTYRWTVDEASVSALDPAAVLGLFLYSSQPTASPSVRKREIDIEHSKFGGARKAPNAQFAVQPYWVPRHRARFSVPHRPGTLTEQFIWQPGGVSFETLANAGSSGTRLVRAFAYDGPDVPTASVGTLLHMNLWMFDKAQPQPNTGLEVVLDAFSFTRAPGAPIIQP